MRVSLRFVRHTKFNSFIQSQHTREAIMEKIRIHSSYSPMSNAFWHHTALWLPTNVGCCFISWPSSHHGAIGSTDQFLLFLHCGHKTNSILNTRLLFHYKRHAAICMTRSRHSFYAVSPKLHDVTVLQVLVGQRATRLRDDTFAAGNQLLQETRSRDVIRVHVCVHWGERGWN